MDEEEGGVDIRERIYHYRAAGETIADIAKLLNMRVNRVASLYREFVTELGKFSDGDTRAQKLQLELDRIDKLQAAYWAQATEPHTAPMSVGRGESSRIEMVEMPPDKDAAKIVLELMKHRAKLEGMEQLNPQDSQVTHQVLVIGTNTQAFAEALAAGREQPQLMSTDQDNVVEGTAVSDEEMGLA